MSLRSIALVMGGTAIGGYVEISHGSTLLESHGTQITAVTPAILLGCGFWSLFHGFTVGRARAKFAEMARKDGEKDVDERYLLPNLYAQGTSKHARAFNCVQRSHQHIFETSTTVAIGGLTGAVVFPICSALSTLMYAVGRYYLSRGYVETEGDASKRYKYSLAKFMWFGLLGNITLGTMSCFMVASGKKKLN